MKKRKFNEEAFFSRLLEVLETEKQTWWAENTGTSQSMVSNYWFKGKYPRGDKIAKILELKNVSANWLYFGLGPKNLGYLDEGEIEKKQNNNRRTQIEIMALADENMRLKEKLEQYETERKKRELLANWLDWDQDEGDNILKDNIIGAFSLARVLLDLIIKMAELYSREKIDHGKLKKIMDWAVRNQDSRKYSTAAMLRDLEAVINP